MDDFDDTQPSTGPFGDTQPSSAPALVTDDSPPHIEVCRLVCTTHQFGGQFILNQESRRRQEWRFGRDKQCEVWLGASKRISKAHFVIWVVRFNSKVFVVR